MLIERAQGMTNDNISKEQGGFRHEKKSLDNVNDNINQENVSKRD